MLKKTLRLLVRTQLRVGVYCQTIRSDNEREKKRLEQKGYTCVNTSVDLGGLVERWACCQNAGNTAV